MRNAKDRTFSPWNFPNDVTYVCASHRRYQHVAFLITVLLMFFVKLWSSAALLWHTSFIHCYATVQVALANFIFLFYTSVRKRKTSDFCKLLCGECTKTWMKNRVKEIMGKWNKQWKRKFKEIMGAQKKENCK